MAFPLPYSQSTSPAAPVLDQLTDISNGLLLNDLDANGYKIRNEGGNVVYASKAGAFLNSNIDTGGGTDDTAALQAILDTAPTRGRLEMVIDDVALISAPLRLRNNTTIRCVHGGGVFLANNAAGAMVTCHATGATRYLTKNIAIIGGTWNGNVAGQTVAPVVDGTTRTWRDESTTVYSSGGIGHYYWKVGMWFHSLDGLIMQDVTIRNATTFGLVLANSRNITIRNLRLQWDGGGLSEAVNIPAYNTGNPPPYDPNGAHNWDGIHLWGNIDNLHINGLYYNGDDDWVAFSGSEQLGNLDPRVGGGATDGAITNVTIGDAVLDNAGTGGRFLASAGAAATYKTIKNVTIRDVRGTVTGHSMLCDDAIIDGLTIDGWFVTNTTLDGNGRKLNSVYLNNPASITNVRLKRIHTAADIYLPATATNRIIEHASNEQVGNLRINDGATVAKILTATASLNFPSIAAYGAAGLPVTVPGAADGDLAIVTPTDWFGIATALITAPDTVSVVTYNPTAAAVDPPAKTFRVVVMKF